MPFKIVSKHTKKYVSGYMIFTTHEYRVHKEIKTLYASKSNIANNMSVPSVSTESNIANNMSVPSVSTESNIGNNMSVPSVSTESNIGNNMSVPSVSTETSGSSHSCDIGHRSQKSGYHDTQITFFKCPQVRAFLL